MKEEVESAVLFLTRLIRNNSSLSSSQVDCFTEHLRSEMLKKFKNHWYLEDPNKGQAYRCIRINETEHIDPVLNQAAKGSSLKYADLKLPPELTLWVDPHEVTCRFGELKGSYCTLANFKYGNQDNKAQSVDIDDLVHKSEVRKMAEINKLLTAATVRRNKATGARSRGNSQNNNSLLQHGSPKPAKFFQPNTYGPKTDKYHWVRGPLVKA